MPTLTQRLLEEIWQSLSHTPPPVSQLAVSGEGELASAFPVTELATACWGAAGLACAGLLQQSKGGMQQALVDRRLASLWFGWTLRPLGWQLPAAWDALAGDYATRDGWIRLHTNAPHHRKAVERVLGPHQNKGTLAQRVLEWQKSELEQAVIEAGGCAAEMRSVEAWRQHIQGKSVAQEPLIHQTRQPEAPPPAWTLPAARPLHGVRVLDLTRIIAGPIATRFLAGLGADVLRIDPYGWDEPGVEHEVLLGKRCARLNLNNAHDRHTFEHLLQNADVIVHGYRAGALEKLGYGAEQRRTLSPGLIDVCLNAYGWSGPWRGRRGFDSLVQMSCGLAASGMTWKNAAMPVPLPVQALDHATGYLMATAVLYGMRERLARGTGYSARLSLARTAQMLFDNPYPLEHLSKPLAPVTEADENPETELTHWGAALRLRAPLHLNGTALQWALPATALGTSQPEWLRR
ncbi:Acetyl-CoA:oxalate CoA-transferase [Serratia plymuthica]|uniref:CoA transferase n=1 Tax=Serratia plymuthica TaxID=82996 RepID=UPI00148B3D4A|nr:CoA transferase [Serratia plymuthica]QJW55032.1 Acetyl-CoA:oxalate CoA-transferase [Serratia plymuthica]